MKPGVHFNLIYPLLSAAVTAALLSACSLSPKLIKNKGGALQAVSPVLDSMNPPAASTFGGSTLAITGSAFQSGATVSVGGQAACLNVKVLTPTQIQCVLPPYASGTTEIVVTNPGAAASRMSYTFRPDIFTQVDFLSGSYTASGFIDGSGRTARFERIHGIASDGVYLYVTTGSQVHVRRVHIQSGQVETWGDPTDLGGGTGNGPLETAQFLFPDGIVRVGRMLYVVDGSAHTIRKIDLNTGTVSTYAGQTEVSGSTDGAAATTALFNGPTAMATDGSFLYVLDRGNYVIRRIDLTTQMVSTLAGTLGVQGMVDGALGTGQLLTPRGLAFASGHLYVADNYCIREIDVATGAINAFAGYCSDNSDGEGFMDGIGPTARFRFPASITSDGANIYIADSDSHLVRKLRTDTGEVSTIAGNPAVSVPGTNDGAIGLALLSYPDVIHYDPMAGLFITSENSSGYRTALRRIH